MTIVYYPNRIYKGKVPAIDRVMAKRNPLTINGEVNLLTDQIDVLISNDENWQLNSIGWGFSNATARQFLATILMGRQVVENLNDALWFQTPNTLPQSITLDPGFYNGTQLATELQTQLDDNDAFNALGLTFTVTYNSLTGLYVVTPSASQIRYLNVNSAQTLRTRDSIAGHLFGFNVNTDFAANVTSDTVVAGLDNEVDIVNQAADTSLTYYHSNFHMLTMDQALYLASNTGVNVTASYFVNYEIIV